MIRIYIADDHDIVRRGLDHILAEQPDMRVTGHAGDVAELLTLLRADEPDVLVLDISMPGASGLSVLPDLRSRYPGVAVVMLSSHAEEEYAVRSLRGGAAGYVSKLAAADELVAAVRHVHAGHTYVSVAVADRLVEDLRGGGVALHERLSPREFEALRLFAAGQSVSQAAETLSLSVKTVSTFRTHLLEKLRLRTTADLIRYAIEKQLV